MRMDCSKKHEKLPSACTTRLHLRQSHGTAERRDSIDTNKAELQANDGVRRVSELQKEVAHCKQERQSCQHTAHQAANNMADLQVPPCSTHKPSCYWFYLCVSQ